MFGIILFNNTSNLYTQWLARRLGVISLSLLVLGAPSPVLANSTADGNAGLSALNRGSYREAIRLFTRAIKAGDLAAADQEFAYLNRGKAYLLEGRKTLALATPKRRKLFKLLHQVQAFKRPCHCKVNQIRTLRGVRLSPWLIPTGWR
jgi:tetratricopeptide (TPR) repeat protein